MQNMPPTKKAGITDWSPPFLADNTLLGVVLNMGMHHMSNIADCFCQAWVNEMPFFFLMFSQGVIVCSYSGTYILHMLRDKVNWKRKSR
jgi:hypothetical protein